MKDKFLRTAVIFSAVLILASWAEIGFCYTPEELLDQGKDLLIKQSDVFGADAKFEEGLSKSPVYPTDERLNFWRAITIISSNPDLKTTLKNLGIISNDTNDDLLLFDERGELKYSPTPVDTIIINDMGAGYSETGTGWITPVVGSMPEECYDDTCRIHPTSTGDKAVWTPNIQTPGDYKVYVWLPASSDAATNATYTVHYDGGGTQSIVQGQRMESGRWCKIGTFRFAAGQTTGYIELSDAANGPVIADAVRLEYEGIYISETDAALNPTGDWQTMPAEYVRGGSYKKINAGSGGTCVWTPTIPTTGKYVISAIWIKSPAGATDAVFTIAPNGQTPTQISVNLRGEGSHLKDLGIFTLQADTGNTITLAQSTSGEVSTDGIVLLPVRAFPNLTEIQSIISSMLTEVDAALECLDEVVSFGFQDHADFGFTDEDGQPYISEIDYGDVWMLRAALNLIKVNLNIYCAYNVNNFNPQEMLFTYEDLISVNYILNRYTSLGTLTTLTPNASTRLADAKQALIDGINAFFDGYDFITNEDVPPGTDPQNNDFITFDSEGQKMCADFIIPKLQEILANLTSTLPTPPFITILSTEFTKADPSVPYYKIALNLREFFDTPKNIRALLPQFASDNHAIRSTAPSPTLGGIFPGMTEAEMNGILQIGPHLWSPCVVWNAGVPSVKLDWQKEEGTGFVSYKIYRSTTDDVGENPDGSPKPGTTLVTTAITDQNTQTYTDTNVSSSERIYYYRLYTYYSVDSTNPPDSVNDKVASEIRRVITKVYVNIGNTSGNEDGTAEHPYKNLGDGIENVSDGGKVFVAAGTYAGGPDNLRLWDHESVVLEGGYEATGWTRDIEANETIIDGAGQPWSCINLSNMDGAIIDGFTVTNATNDDQAGINLWNCRSVVVKNCTITNSNCGVNVGQSSSCVIENCNIQGRRALSLGHSGINAWQSTSIEIKNCTIENNKDQAVGFGNNSSVTVEGCTLRNNSAGVNTWDSSSAYIIGCTITQNNWGIGAHGDAVIFNNIVENNSQEGINCFGNGVASATIRNNTILNNGGAAGLVYGNMANITIQNNILINNNSGDGKKGIYGGSATTASITNNNSYGHTNNNYYNCGTDAGEDGNISADPLFVTGPAGEYYLSQTAAGQGANSPCIDSGSGTAETLGLQDATTRTDEVADSGTVDMGCHYKKGAGHKKDDIVIDFSSGGIWIYQDNTTWTKLHDLTANAITTGDINGDNKDEVLLNYGTAGLWMYQNTGTWTKIHDIAPKSMVTGDIDGNDKDEIILDYDTAGIWIYSDGATWTKLHDLTANTIAVGDINGN